MSEPLVEADLSDFADLEMQNHCSSFKSASISGSDSLRVFILLLSRLGELDFGILGLLFFIVYYLYTILLQGVEPPTPSRTPRLLDGGGPCLVVGVYFQ